MKIEPFAKLIAGRVTWSMKQETSRARTQRK
jgi:hypothetical protein